MAHITRNLTFVTNDLGKDAILALTFDSTNNPDEYKSLLPIIWKVAHFKASGHYAFTVTYKSDFGFTSTHVSSDSVVVPSVYTHIDRGQKTILTESGFSTPTSIQPPTKLMEAENGTHEIHDFGFGFFERPDLPPNQILLFNHVGPSLRLLIDFTPILSGYITTGYKEGEILRGQIASPVIFKENLASLEEETHWRLEYDQATGSFKITRIS